MLNWTPQQEAFFTRLRDTDDSIALHSCAGSGKSVTATEGITLLSGSVLAVAFNKKTREDWEEKLAAKCFLPEVTCCTMNALGHRALSNFFGKSIKIDSNKVRAITRELVEKEVAKLNDPALWDLLSPVMSLVGKAKHHGIVPLNTPGTAKGLLEDSTESWLDLALRYDVHFDDEVERLARAVLRRSNSLSWERVCDFDDQIYISTCWGARFRKYDNIVIDEAQDLSEIQHEMLRKSLRKGGRLIAVGDPNQAIYGFRAAMSDSMANLGRTFGLKEMALTVSFRCAKSIVVAAQQIVPSITAAESAPIGLVQYRSDYDEDLFGSDDAVLCRTNAPLVNLAYRLIASGRGANLLSRDLGKGLQTLVKRLSGGRNNCSQQSLLTALADWREREHEAAIKKGWWRKAGGIEDKAESLRTILNSGQVETAKEALAAVEELFGKDAGQVTLSSIHRAKGLEWDRVFFLDEQLIPSVWTEKAVEHDEENCRWMLQEEDNLRYVAITRARLKLTYITSDGWEA